MGLRQPFPAVALAYIGVHWRTARKGVGLAALGCIPLVVGLALASHDAARLEAILSLRWLKPEARPPAELAIALSGEFNGKPFAPQSELIGGVLSLRQGHDFYAQREQIRLPAQPLGALRLDVLPRTAARCQNRAELAATGAGPARGVVSCVAIPCTWTCGPRRRTAWRASST